MACQSLDNDEILNVRWATEDPNPTSKVLEQERILAIGREAIKERMDPRIIEPMRSVQALEEGKDSRDEVDEDGEEDEEEADYEYEEAQPFEEEVGVEAIDLKNWERRTGVKRTATSSGVSLPGHSDRKELLGRIGCEKQVD